MSIKGHDDDTNKKVQMMHGLSHFTEKH